MSSLRASNEVIRLNVSVGQILLQAQQLVAMNRPAARDRKSLQIFMENGFLENGEPIRPLLKADTEFVYQQEDLVTLRPGRESAWLDAIIERMLKMVHCKPVQVSVLQVLKLGSAH